MSPRCLTSMTFAAPPTASLGSVSRRIFLLAAATVPVAAVATSAPTKPRAAARFIATHCRGFLSARGSTKAVLWRGGDAVGIIDPPSDLLDPATYGSRGAEYFRALSRASCPVDPAVAHLGTGSLANAAAWGEPVSIWPVGNDFKYMYWRDYSLVYDGDRDGAEQMDGETILHRNGPYSSSDLGGALEAGKEVMFDAHEGFIAVSEQDTAEVVSMIEDLNQYFNPQTDSLLWNQSWYT